MLVLNGTAEYTEDDGDKIKGERYAFNLFSTIEDIDEAIEDIALFLGELGWNEIDIKKRKVIPNDSEIIDKILREAFEHAKENMFSVVVYGEPVDEDLKL